MNVLFIFMKCINLELILCSVIYVYLIMRRRIRNINFIVFFYDSLCSFLSLIVMVGGLRDCSLIWNL